MATSILPVSPSVITAASGHPPKQVVDPLTEATMGFLRKVFELSPEIVLLPGDGSSLGCPIARTLTDLGLKNVWVMKTRLRYSEPDGQWRTVLLNASARRFIAKFDSGLIPELLIHSQRPVLLGPF